MMAISHIKIVAAVSKHVAELIEKPSDGIHFTPPLGIQIVSNPHDPFTIQADIQGPSNIFT